MRVCVRASVCVCVVCGSCVCCRGHTIWLFCFVLIQRCPLESLVLSVKVLDIGEPRAILRLALEPPHLADIEKTILNLKEVNIISLSKGHLVVKHNHTKSSSLIIVKLIKV